MPQARHGGKGVFALAALGSKFEGTGLENEQIGQIQVALKGACCEVLLEDAEASSPVIAEAPSLADLGINVTLGDDFRKPAYRSP